MSDRAVLLQQLRFRTPLYSPDVPFVMGWSQKAGCTAVLKWFLFHAGQLDEALGYGGEKPGSVRSLHRYENEVLKQAPCYLELLAEQLEAGMPVYCFLRCPFERAFSSYLHLHNPMTALYPGRDTPAIRTRAQLLRWRYGSDVPLEYPVSFADYLEWLAQQAFDEVDAHHRPQYHPWYDTVDVAFRRLETLSRAALELEERFGLASTQGNSAELFSSGHHTPKRTLSREASLAFLQRGMPLGRTERFEVPRVDRDLLEGTGMGATIASLFRTDLELYDAAG